MIPRAQMDCVSVEDEVPEFLPVVVETRHSRFPVIGENKDDVIGILLAKELLNYYANPEGFNLHDTLRPAVFVPEGKRLNVLLREFRAKRNHMAVVVDEYGGFSGIVTLEDILREIVGDIRDEFEDDEKSVEKQADDSFLVDAMLPIEDFARAFDFKFPEGEFETLGGFLASLAGSIPELNDRFTHNGWVFIVQVKAGPRLERIRVLKPKLPERRASYDRLEAVKA